MSISVKNISLSINGTQSEQFKIEIDGAKYRLDDFSLKQQLLVPAKLTFTLRKDPEEDISEIQFSACSTIIGKEVTLTLQTDNIEEKITTFSDAGRNADLEFEGFIIAADASRQDSEYVIQVEAMSKDVALMDHPDCHVYNEYKLADIINEVLGRASVKGKVQPKYEDQIYYTVQYNESSYQFLQRQARRYGEWMFSTGRELHFGKLADQESIQLKYPSQDLSEYTIRLQTFHQNFMFAGLGVNNFNKGTSYEGTDQPATGNKLNDSVFNSSKEVYVHRTRRIMEGAGLEADEKVESGTMPEPEFIQQAQAERQGTRANMLVYTGTTFCSKLKIGAKLSITDNYISSSTEKSEVQQDEILITEVTHTFGVDDQYSNTFQGITAAIDYPPYLNTTIYPRCDHPVRAHVVETEDPKHWGRVKVRFAWQINEYRSGEKSGSTPWIPVAQPYIGQDDNAFGAYIIPEKYSEVYVDFEEGNFERPYVAGAVFSQRTPVDAAWYPGNNNVKALRTASGHTIEIHDNQSDEEFGVGGYIKIYDNNTLNYEVLLSTDSKLIRLKSKGNIELYADRDIIMKAGNNIKVTAGKDYTLDVRHDITENADNEYSQNSGTDMYVNVGHDLMETVEHDQTLTIHNDRKTTIDHNDELTVEVNQFVTVNDSKDEQVANDLQVSANNIREEAKNELKEYSTSHDIKASNAVAINANATIDIKGGMVKVN